MTARRLPIHITRLLDGHGLMLAPEELVRELADRIRWAQRRRAPTKSALNDRARQRCLTLAQRLRRHQCVKPRDPQATENARKELLTLLDSLGAVVKLSARSNFDVGDVICELRAKRTPSDESLQGLIKGIEEIPPSVGSPTPTGWNNVTAHAVAVWRHIHGSGGYTYDGSRLLGRLPLFVRDVLDVAGLCQPTDDALHHRLRALKNL